MTDNEVRAELRRLNAKQLALLTLTYGILGPVKGEAVVRGTLARLKAIREESQCSDSSQTS